MTSRLPSRSALIAFALLVASLPRSAGAADVTACGQTIGARDTGVLQADLDCLPLGFCSGDAGILCALQVTCDVAGAGSCVLPGPAVMIDQRGTLDLNGHTIAGTVLCTGPRCQVIGPGMLVGHATAPGHPNVLLDGDKIAAVDVDVVGGRFGIRGARRLTLRNVTVTDALADGIKGGSLRAVNVVSTDNGVSGIDVTRLKGENITASRNGGCGIQAFTKLRGTDVVVEDNGTELTRGAERRCGMRAQGGAVRVKFAAARRNTGPGIIAARAVRANDTVVRDNGGPGVVAGRSARLSRCTVRENDTSGSGIDLLTGRKPRLSDTLCARSLSPITQRSWGVCALGG